MGTKESHGACRGSDAQPVRSPLGFVRLQLAREDLGILRVLVTCDEDNLGSLKTIENNGGRLESVLRDPNLPKALCRYWIESE
jgi:predicted acetyltransferase